MCCIQNKSTPRWLSTCRSSEVKDNFLKRNSHAIFVRGSHREINGFGSGQRESRARRWVRSRTQVRWQNFLRVQQSNAVPLCSQHGYGIQGPNKLFGLLNSVFREAALWAAGGIAKSLGTIRCCRLVRAESLPARIKCFSSVSSQGGTAHF